MVIAIIAILAALLLPALSQSKARAEAITCMSNIKQLSLAWSLYADDNGDFLVNNYGKPQTIATRNTWANNVETWGNDDDNTNLTYVTQTLFSPYDNQSARIYKCPSDRAQAANGPRIRSMSMNAMVGDPGVLTNVFNPLYMQFFKTADILTPSHSFFGWLLRYDQRRLLCQPARGLSMGQSAGFVSQRRGEFVLCRWARRITSLGHRRYGSSAGAGKRRWWISRVAHHGL